MVKVYRTKQSSKRWSAIKRKYGLTEDQWMRIYLEQARSCFICGRLMKLGGKTTPRTASTDHCHITGRIRGIVCMACNTRLLPHFEKNIELAKNLFVYLTRETNYGFVPEKSTVP